MRRKHAEERHLTRMSYFHSQTHKTGVVYSEIRFWPEAKIPEELSFLQGT